MTENSTCPKCSSDMEAGFVADKWNRTQQFCASWVQGDPEKALWVGIDISGRAQLPIKSFRCTKCGFLEMYATTSEGAGSTS